MYNKMLGGGIINCDNISSKHPQNTCTEVMLTQYTNNQYFANKAQRNFKKVLEENMHF